MKNIFALIALSAVIFCHTLNAQSPVSFVMNISPGSFLTSFQLSEFSVSQGIPGSTSMHVDGIDGSLSLTPFVGLGVSINTSVLFIDITGNGGFLYNKVFYGSTYKGDIALRFRPSSVFTVGIHGGPVFGKLNWDHDGPSGNDDVELSKFIGYNFGPTMTIGKSANFVFSVDYLIAGADVDTHNGWRASDSEINLSGLVVSFGFLLRIPYPHTY